MTIKLLNMLRKVLRAVLGCLLGLSAMGLWAAELSACLVEPSHTAEVGSAVVGVIDRVTFERGDAVNRGQALVFLKADVEQAATGLASARAKAEAEVRSAQSNNDFAQRKLQRSIDLQQQNFISQQALDQTRTEAELAEQKLVQARENQRVLHQELALARAQLAQRTIVSPIEGVVLERYVTTGERVEQQTVAKIATLDPLRVEVIVPAVHFNKIQPGMSATIRPDLPEAGERQAKVVLVDRVIDTASNSFRVRLELPNPGKSLPAGVRCKADFGFSTVAKSIDKTQTSRRPIAPTTAPAASSIPVPVKTGAPALLKPTENIVVPQVNHNVPGKTPGANPARAAAPSNVTTNAPTVPTPNLAIAPAAKLPTMPSEAKLPTMPSEAKLPTVPSAANLPTKPPVADLPMAPSAAKLPMQRPVAKLAIAAPVPTLPSAARAATLRLSTKIAITSLSQQ